jgi:hypothetical protein
MLAKDARNFTPVRCTDLRNSNKGPIGILETGSVAGKSYFEDYLSKDLVFAYRHFLFAIFHLTTGNRATAR